jgi:hypothetical protein
MPWGLAGTALAAYFGLLVVFVLVKAVPVKSPAIQRLRAFFPSWKFFDDVGHVPVLLARVGARADALGPWQPCLAPAPRPWHAPLIDAEATLLLAYGSLLQQLVADVEELPDDADHEDTVSYQLTHHLVQARLALAPGAHYQFRLCLVEPGATPTDDDDMIVSPVYQAQA